jgi:hypothetical protein
VTSVERGDLLRLGGSAKEPAAPRCLRANPRRPRPEGLGPRIDDFEVFARQVIEVSHRRECLEHELGVLAPEHFEDQITVLFRILGTDVRTE